MNQVHASVNRTLCHTKTEHISCPNHIHVKETPVSHINNNIFYESLEDEMLAIAVEDEKFMEMITEMSTPMKKAVLNFRYLSETLKRSYRTIMLKLNAGSKICLKH